MPISHLTHNLNRNDDGILTSDLSSSVSYPENGNLNCFQIEENSYWFQHRNECIVSAIKQFTPVGTILDVGGGNGFVANRLLSEGFSAAVLEPGKIGASIAKKIRGIPEVINATFKAAGFEDEVLSAIGLFDVLEHIEDDRSFIDLIWRTLIPGGLLFLTVPAYPALWSFSDVSAKHFRRYNFKMLHSLINDRFLICYATHMFAVLTLPTVLFRVLPYKLMPQKENRFLSIESEHGIRKGFLSDLVVRALKAELKKVKAGKKVKMGTSILMVMEKK